MPMRHSPYIWGDSHFSGGWGAEAESRAVEVPKKRLVERLQGDGLGSCAHFEMRPSVQVTSLGGFFVRLLC